MYKGLGPAIRQIRESKNLKQQEVEKAGGITKGTLSKWEKGRRIPSDAQEEKILKGLDCHEYDFAEIKRDIEKNFYDKKYPEKVKPTLVQDSTIVSELAIRLLAVDLKAIPPELRSDTDGMRSSLLAIVAGLQGAVNHLRGIFNALCFPRAFSPEGSDKPN
jgi:transcriptional regulator with XRE-family HTH domain